MSFPNRSARSDQELTDFMLVDLWMFFLGGELKNLKANSVLN